MTKQFGGPRKPAKSFFERELFWPLNLDFFAPMRLQKKVNEDQELYYFKGKTTETLETEKSEPVKTDLGLKIGQKDTSGRRTVIEFGSRNPEDEYIVTQDEIYKDVLANTGVEDIITKRRGLTHSIPREMEDSDVLQGAEEIWEEQKAYSNKSKQWRKATGLPLKNWYNLYKNKALSRGIIDKSDVNDWFCTSLRSSLNTEFVLPSNDQGYDMLQKRDELLPLEKSLVKGNFWEDTGLPVQLLMNHRQKAEGWIYELDKEDYPIGF